MRRVQQLALATAFAAAFDRTRHARRRNRLRAVAASETLNACALAIMAQSVRGAVEGARAPSAILARPAGQAEAAALDTRTMAGAHQTIQAHAGHPAAKARKAIVAVALPVHAHPVAAAAVGASLGGAVGRGPSGVAHALLVDARAVLGAARGAERGRALDSAKTLRAMAGAIVAFAMGWRATCRARLRRAIGALEAVVALARPAS